MNKKTKGLLAGAAGAALLLGGGTFALWSDSETIDGGTITAGNLDIELVGDPAWQDVSDDRTDSPHTIDLDEFRIVPGDTIQGTFGLAAALQGDNIVAELGLATGEAEGDLLKGLDVHIAVVDGEGEILSADGTAATVQFVSEDNPVGGGLDSLPAVVGTDATFDVVVTVTFDEGTSEQELVQASAALSSMTVTFDQVREDAPGYN